jgi:RNA polymerase sigma-70 factor (ECF subfamily)
MLKPNASHGELSYPAQLDTSDRDRFAEELYPELRRIAAVKLRRERADHTLQPTALVGELWLHLLRNPDTKWHDRNHFLVAASRAMHRYLVDHARARGSQKRGGQWHRSTSEIENVSSENPAEVLQIHDLLERLQEREPRMASVVEMRFFGGLTFSEISAILSVDERTVKRDWTLARAWLRGHMGESEYENDGGRVGKD